MLWYKKLEELSSTVQSIKNRSRNYDVVLKFLGTGPPIPLSTREHVPNPAVSRFSRFQIPPDFAPHDFVNDSIAALEFFLFTKKSQ